MSKAFDIALEAVSKIGKPHLVASHTPTPWTIGEFQENSFINQRPINPAIGAVYGDKNETLVNAAFIVRACNAHDALVEALELVKDKFQCFDDDAWETVHKALKLAKGE